MNGASLHQHVGSPIEQSNDIWGTDLTVLDEPVRYSRDAGLRRFGDLVKLSGLGDRFIDRAQERRLLEEGVTRFDLTLDEARGVLRSVAEDQKYVFESDAGRRIEQVMSRQAGKKGRISRRQFRQTVQMLRDFSDNTISEVEARRQLKLIMLDNGWQPRRAGLFRTRRWFRQVAT